MRDRLSPIYRFAAITMAVLAVGLAGTGAARADVFGRLKFSVKNAADEKPISGAKIVLKDSANAKPDVTLTTAADGTVTSGQIDARAWQATTSADTFQDDTRNVTVVADTTTDVEVLLEPLKEKVIKITGQRDVIQRTNTSSSVQRTAQTLEKFPVTAGNPQSFNQVLKTVPGAAQDSVNQVHIRGEHADAATQIDGFALGGVLQGRGGPTINPSVIQTLNVLTGGYAPEYGGEMAAVFNIGLKSGTIRPMREILLQGGEWNTLYGDLEVGGQLGSPTGAPDASGAQARRFSYYLNLSGRRTDNALEPPQPDPQDAHNHGESQIYFGNFGYRAGDRDQLTLALNAAPAYTQIANRAGLPAEFADVGQGFGFEGHLSAADAATAGIVSQQAAGQDIYQRDDNSFGALNWRHTFSGNLNGLLSLGLDHAGLDIRNNNPAVNFGNLPQDNSIEFNPTITRHAHNIQVQGSLTATSGRHTFKFGIRNDEVTNNETYHLVPASQFALNAVATLYESSTVGATPLLPAGSFQTDESGKNVQDAFGNDIFTLANPAGTTAASFPVVAIHETRSYRAFYAQDTWNATRRFTANYGARLDWYKSDVTLLGMKDSIDTVHVSPRVNLAYLLAPGLLARAAYDRMFSVAPLAQSAVLGQAIPPQRGDLYEGSLEKQIGSNQTVRATFYYKDWRDFADTGLLIKGTQIGAFSTFSHPHVMVRGFELTYDLFPRNNVGFGSYVTYANAVNKLLAPETGYTDHDQLNTIGFGLDHTWRSQAVVGMSLYYGSGVASSVVRNDQRTPRTIVNLRLASAPNLFGGSTKNGRGGLSVDVENLFDDRSVINFASAFSGTRFQQGRRVLVSANGRF